MAPWKAATLLLCVGYLWVLLAIATAESRIAFVYPPAYASADAPTTFEIRVPRHAENRLLLLAAFDGEFRMTGTERDLHGEASAVLHNVRLHLPPGEFVLVAAVRSADAEVGRTTHRIRVTGRGP